MQFKFLSYKYWDIESFKNLIMIQGFLNLVLTLCDVSDSVVLFAPYFFNAQMSFNMTGITNILIGPTNPMTLNPDPGLILSLVNPNSISISTSRG